MSNRPMGVTSERLEYLDRITCLGLLGICSIGLIALINLQQLDLYLKITSYCFVISIPFLTTAFIVDVCWRDKKYIPSSRT